MNFYGILIQEHFPKALVKEKQHICKVNLKKRMVKAREVKKLLTY